MVSSTFKLMILENELICHFSIGKTMLTPLDLTEQDSCLPVQLQYLFAPHLTWVLLVASKAGLRALFL